MTYRICGALGWWALFGVVLGGCSSEAPGSRAEGPGASAEATSVSAPETTSNTAAADTACTPYSTFHLLGSNVFASPLGDYASSQPTNAQGFYPTGVVTPNGLVWYTDALTGTFNGGFYDLSLWTNSPGGHAPIFAQLGVSAVDGSNFNPLAVSSTVDVSTTGTGNHVTTLAIHALAPIALENQRLVVKVFLQTSVGTSAPTAVFNGGLDFDSNLATPGGCATIAPPTCLSGELPRVTATASSAQIIPSGVLSGGPPTNTINDNPYDGWFSDDAGPQWLMIDLGAVREVNRLTIIPDLNQQLAIQGSNDGVNFTTLTTYTGSGGGGPAPITGFETRTRYVRFFAPNGHMTFDEVGVFGDSDPSCTPLSGLAKAVVTSDCVFAGNSVGLREGKYDASALSSLGVPGSTISSVEVAEGYDVSLFQNAGFGGFETYVTTDQGCLVSLNAGRSDGSSWNDDVLSLEVNPVAANSGGVQLFADWDFGGASQRFGAGIYDAASGAFTRVPDRSISSLTVAPGFRALLCTQDSSAGINTGNLGLCRLYTEGSYPYVGDDLNDRTELVAVGTGPLPSSGYTVQAYVDANLGGSWNNFGTGFYEAYRGEFGSFPNDALSSLNVSVDTWVIACANDGFGGRTNTGNVGLCRLFNQGAHDYVGDDLNDQTSMLVVAPPRP